MKKAKKIGTLTAKEERAALLQKIQRLANELGSTNKEICRILNVNGDDDLDWLVTDTIAAAATFGGALFGTREYITKRKAHIRQLEKKLGL